MMIPLSAIAAIALLWVDPHTGEGSSALPSYIAAAGSAALLIVSWRVGRRFVELNRDARRRRGRHEMLIDLFASRRPDLGDVHVIQDDRLFAYSVPCFISGRIVLSQAVLDTLDRPSLEAIFAHERAHLRGRHHLIMQLAMAVGVVFHRTRAADFSMRMSELVELSADCHARRHAGSGPMINALTALADVPMPITGMPAGGTALAVRLASLRGPSRCCRARGLHAVLAAFLLPALILSANQLVDLCLFAGLWTTL
jgi:hypothetical protein